MIGFTQRRIYLKGLSKSLRLGRVMDAKQDRALRRHFIEIR
jgi:hypothetical protein